MNPLPEAENMLNNQDRFVVFLPILDNEKVKYPKGRGAYVRWCPLGENANEWIRNQIKEQTSSSVS